jgi:hypothetical protein
MNWDFYKINHFDLTVRQMETKFWKQHDKKYKKINKDYCSLFLEFLLIKIPRIFICRICLSILRFIRFLVLILNLHFCLTKCIVKTRHQKNQQRNLNFVVQTNWIDCSIKSVQINREWCEKSVEESALWFVFNLRYSHFSHSQVIHSHDK